MLWEGKRLRDIQEADVRRIVESGLEELWFAKTPAGSKINKIR